jgi:hypothetical protein
MGCWNGTDGTNETYGTYEETPLGHRSHETHKSPTSHYRYFAERVSDELIEFKDWAAFVLNEFPIQKNTRFTFRTKIVHAFAALYRIVLESSSDRVKAKAQLMCTKEDE